MVMGFPTASWVERISTCRAERLVNEVVKSERKRTYLVFGSDLVIVGGVGEGKRKHTLLLQVGLVDTGERSGDDGKTTEMSGLKSGMLSGRALTVVPVTNDDPLDTLGLVVTGDSRDGIPFTVGEVEDLVGLTVGLVDGTNQHVVGDVVKMATVLEPGTSHGDVIGGGLAVALDEDRNVVGILTVPGLEGGEDLETIGGGGDVDVDAGTVLGGSLVSIVTGVVATLGKTLAGGRREHELVAVLVLELIGEGVEVKRASNGQGDDHVGRGDERVSGGVTVVSASEVSVEGRDDGVGSTLLDVLSVPLTDARTASVGHDNTAELLKGLELTIAGNGSANLLGTGGDGEDGLSLDTVVDGVTSDGGSSGHVLVRGVGARADETDLELLGPVVILDGLAELGDGSGQIGSEGTVDMGLKLVQVDLDELIVLGALITTELLGVRSGEVTNLGSLGSSEVVVHAIVEGEDGGCGTNLGSHVRDGSHSGAGEGVDTRAVVLDDGSSTTLDSYYWAYQYGCCYGY